VDSRGSATSATDSAVGGAPAIVRIDDASPTPKYQQIVEQVKTLVVAGVLRPGAPLPSVRQLAGDLGINVNTVVAAYRALEAEELVLLRRGSRAVIHPRLARINPPPDAVGRVRALLEHVRTEARLLGLSAQSLAALAAEVFGEDLGDRRET
jgi:GntR family transcriptional regulator